MSAPHPAVQYLTALFEPEDVLCLTFISGTKTYSHGGAVTENKFVPMSQVITDEGIKRLTQRNADDHVYASMATFKPESKNRTKANIARAAHVFIEADENGEAVLADVRSAVAAREIPAPTIILESSPGKFQFIWNVDGFDVPLQEAMNKTLQQRFGTDPQSVDAARVLRIAGFKNIKPKYADPKPVATIIEHNKSFMAHEPGDFAIPLAVEPDDPSKYVAVDDEIVQQKIELLRAAMEAASVSHAPLEPWAGSGGAFKFVLTVCPWNDTHTNGNLSDAMTFVQPNGAYGFKCLHAHCADKDWEDFRAHLENLAGRKLHFAVKPPKPTLPPAKPPKATTPKSLGAAAATTFTESGTSPTSNSYSIAAFDAEAGIVRPALNDAVFYGLAGQIIKKLQPQTESHPAGNLVELMLSFGNVLGRSAYVQIENTRHYTNEFMVKVGESSKARKGTGKNRIRALMELVDPEWRRNCNTSGIGSGEVIVHLIRDARTELVVDKKTGAAKPTLTDAGIADKRLCVSIGEFQGILAVCHKPEGLLSIIFRDGWDGEPLKNTVKTDPASCEEGHLTIMADTTRADLSVSLNQADRKNGFANRFLWVYVHRTQLLPFGGEKIDWTAEAAALREAVEFGRNTCRVFMDEGARKLWSRTLYPKLERDIPGLVGSIIGRGSAHTLRLAMIYALLDQSEHIRREHLEAAYALWQYCEDSAQAIFGELLSPEQMQILDFLVMGGMNKTRLYRDCFSGHRRADQIQNDLNILESLGKITAKADNGMMFYYIRSAAPNGTAPTPENAPK